MSAETRSLNTLYTTMRNTYINSNNTLNHLSHTIVQISRIMLQLNEADTLYAAVQQTVTGSLSHLTEFTRLRNHKNSTTGTRFRTSL